MSLQEDIVAKGEFKDCKDKCSATTEAPLLTLIGRMSELGPLKYLFSMFRRLSTWTIFSTQVEEVKATDANVFTGRRWVIGKKRLSRLARFVFTMAPCRLQQLLGFPLASSLGEGEISDERRNSPNKPRGKGSKRKQDDLAEEELCWVESLSCDLPDDDDDSVEDPSYEPSKYYTDSEDVSEEHRECNDTETDLEVEETGDPGLMRLKETPCHEENENNAPCIDSEEHINS
ncbi:oogenesis-related [Heterodontus francisci]|uniref:oogenesis-related n=1 Tax=Heterodontus francisci TaxID=7792 RepID=UPI00355C99A8